MAISFPKRLLSIICIILCIVLIPILLLNCIIIVKSFSNTTDVPSVFGYYPLVVLSDSMLGEFKNGDLIICKTIEADNVKIGDIISFYDPDLLERKIVTHRVIDIKHIDGETVFLTKGDINNGEDQSLVPSKNLAGQYLFCIKDLGKLVIFLQSTKGLLHCVFLPTLILLTIEYLKYMPRKEKKGDKYELQNS